MGNLMSNPAKRERLARIFDTAVYSVASTASLLFGVVQLLNQQMLPGIAFILFGVYAFGWACAR